MTAQQAQALGYEVIAASPFEVGLVKNGKGIRTWWSQEFDGRLPGMDHPTIMESIILMEDFERTMGDMICSDNANQVDSGDGKSPQ